MKLLEIALIGIPVGISIILFLATRKRPKKPPYLELRSSKEQNRFNPLKTVYNPKEFRRQRK